MSFGEIPECNHGGPIRTKELKSSTDGQIKVECMYNPAEYTVWLIFFKKFYEDVLFFFWRIFINWFSLDQLSGRDKNQHL